MLSKTRGDESMSSSRDIQERIRSVEVAQITKAMQMVAASKMRSAGGALAGRPFVRLIYRFQREATTATREFNHPLLEVRG